MEYKHFYDWLVILRNNNRRCDQELKFFLNVLEVALSL